MLSTTLICFLLLSQQASVPSQDGALLGVDVFGTDKITVETIQTKFGDDFKKLAQAISSRDNKVAGETYEKVVNGIQAMGDFAFVSLASITYFDRHNGLYITVDIVENKDKEKRINFLPPPSKHFEDPDGLIAKWREYEEKGLQLAVKGQLPSGKPSCPVFHCVWGFTHPQLKSYEAIFQSGVPKDKERLERILHEDSQPQNRAAAAFLLAHISDAKELIKQLLSVIKDSDSTVRNNAMRVFAQMAESHKEIAIPIRPFIEALDFPTATDRNKALATLDSLAERAENKKVLSDDAGLMLVKILRLVQPNNHDYAYSILKKISGKDLGERNYDDWLKWLDSRKH